MNAPTKLSRSIGSNVQAQLRTAVASSSTTLSWSPSVIPGPDIVPIDIDIRKHHSGPDIFRRIGARNPGERGDNNIVIRLDD
jgi:hypothetical protein